MKGFIHLFHWTGCGFESDHLDWIFQIFDIQYYFFLKKLTKIKNNIISAHILCFFCSSCWYIFFTFLFFKTHKTITWINDTIISCLVSLLALPTKALKDIVFRFIIEYNSSLRDFYRPLLGDNNNNNNNRSIFVIWGFLKDNNILAYVETWD
jgi:hypothetical protein